MHTCAHHTPIKFQRSSYHIQLRLDIYNFTGVHRCPSVPSLAQTKSGLGDLMNSLRLGQRNGVVSVAFEKALKHCAIHCIVPRNKHDCDCLYFFLFACVRF